MEYSQFIDDVKNHIRFQIEDEYEIKVNRIMKNNSVELDGIVFFKEGDNISPNIYLNSYYERYQEGESVERIAEDIIHLYEQSKGSQSPDYQEFEFEFDKVKEFLVYRLVNYQKNRKLLKEVPHVRFLDLAITFHCLVKEDDEGIGTIRITNEHMNLWGVSIKELMRLATINTRRCFPVKINTMEEVITEIMKREYSKLAQEEGMEGGNGEQEMLEDMLHEMFQKEDKKMMYIMTNRIGINGATALIYKDALKEFSQMCNNDFYILPSSIHEVILVPYEEEMEVSGLREMVSDVNGSHVPLEEVLSDRVYIYRREGNSIELA